MTLSGSKASRRSKDFVERSRSIPASSFGSMNLWNRCIGFQIPEPRSGSTTKPTVAERTLGEQETDEINPEGVGQDLESGKRSVTFTPFRSGRKLSRNRWDSSLRCHPFLQSSP